MPAGPGRAKWRCMKKEMVLGRNRRPDEIKALLELFRSSNQSPCQFAQEQGVSTTTIYNWLQRYPLEPTPPAALSEVQLSPVPGRAVAAHPEGYQVLLSNGHALRVPARYDWTEVQSLVQLLASL